MAGGAHEVAIRRAVVAAALVCALLVFAPRVGEQDRGEACAIGWIRALQDLEQTQAKASGWYATPECLADPDCAPDVHRLWSWADFNFSETRVACGYRLQFHAGAPVTRSPAEAAKARALTRFAAVAVPVSGSPGERRAFCGDDRGRIYYRTAGAVPRVSEGRCLDTAREVR